jgi:hypothetical protein
VVLIGLHSLVGGRTPDELVGPFGFVRAVGHLVVATVFIGVVYSGRTRLGPDDVEYARVYEYGCVIAGRVLEALTVEISHGDCLLVLDKMREEFVDGWTIEGIQSTVRRQ